MAIDYKQRYMAMSDEETNKLSLSIAPRGYEPALKDILKLVSRLETLDSLDTNGMHSLAMYARIQIFRKLTVVFEELFIEYQKVTAEGHYRLLTVASLNKLCKIIKLYLCENNNLYNKQFVSSIYNDNEEEQFNEITFIIDNFTSYLINKTKECNELLSENGIESDDEFNEECKFEDCFKRFIDNIICLAERIKDLLFQGIEDPYNYFFDLAYKEFGKIIDNQWSFYSQKLERYLVSDCDKEVGAIIGKIRQEVEQSGFLDVAKTFYDSTTNDSDFNGIWLKVYNENGVINKETIGHILLNHSDDLTIEQASRIMNFAILEPKLQNYTKERKSRLNKKQTFNVDKNDLWKGIEKRINLIPLNISFVNEPSKDWNIANVKQFFRNALNIDNHKLSGALNKQSEDLCRLFYKRKSTKDERCFDATFLNILGYAAYKKILPDKETDIIRGIYEDNEILDNNKGLYKSGKNVKNPISEFQDLLENAYERLG